MKHFVFFKHFIVNSCLEGLHLGMLFVLHWWYVLEDSCVCSRSTIAMIRPITIVEFPLSSTEQIKIPSPGKRRQVTLDFQGRYYLLTDSLIDSRTDIVELPVSFCYRVDISNIHLTEVHESVPFCTLCTSMDFSLDTLVMTITKHFLCQDGEVWN